MKRSIKMLPSHHHHHQRTMLSPNRCMALGVCLLMLVSLFFQGTLEMSSTENLLAAYFQQRTLEIIDEFAGRQLEQRNVVRKDEFWLTESEQAYLPFDMEYIPPGEDYGPFEPAWTETACSSSGTKAAAGRSKKIVLVHIVRTLGDALHDALASYASSCRAGIAYPVMCSGLSWESMIAGSWANRNSIGGRAEKCLLKEGTSRSGNTIDKQYIQNDWLEEKVDILSGQVPMGCHEKWKDNHNNKDMVDVQYIVSLRDPYDWFVTGMIERLEKEEEESPDTDTVVKAIQDKVEKDLASGKYHEIYSRYLITPAQISWIQKEQADLSVEDRTGLALKNLVDNRAVIAIADDMEGSMEKLQYIMGGNDKASQVQPQTERKEQEATVGTILRTLKKDKEFYPRFEEYLSYEKQIYDEAKGMHQRQLAWLREQHQSASADSHE